MTKAGRTRGKVKRYQDRELRETQTAWEPEGNRNDPGITWNKMGKDWKVLDRGVVYWSPGLKQWLPTWGHDTLGKPRAPKKIYIMMQNISKN